MKPHTASDYIQQLIAQGEHRQQDFKFEISDARKIAKTLSAFSNTAGGRLLIGVKDNGKIAGVRSEEEIYMIEAAAQTCCDPPISYTAESYEVEGRMVLCVQIAESEEKPVCAIDEAGKRWAYLRIDDENILATPVHLHIWQQIRRDHGELTLFAERELSLLKQMQEQGAVTLNGFCKMSRMPRHRAAELLARFIRYEVVEELFESHRFLFRIR